MPLPEPQEGEKEKDFLDRCMSDDMAVKDFPDNKQRLAVCGDLWRKKKEKKQMNFEREVREVTFEELRVTGGDGKPVKIEGYAALFDTLSEDLGGFREKIQQGAFRKSLRKSDTRALFNHDKNFVLGRRRAKTLTLKEDNEGLRIKISPPDTTWARDLVTSINRGDIDQMSFGFIAKSDEWEEHKKYGAVRTLVEIERLMDVSIVTYPAYTDTSVAVRSHEHWKEETKKADETVEAPKGAGKLKVMRKKLELLKMEGQ